MAKRLTGGALLLSAWIISACSGSGTGSSPDEGQGPGTGTTTGEDAGGTTAPPACGRNTTPCEVGETCGGPPDCATAICREGTCRASAPDNGKLDGDETDVDCGGASAPACVDGKACKLAADCVSAVCTGNVCQEPKPNDGVKNGTETDVDCGGSTGIGCATGKGCKATADCDAALCTNAVCAAPSTTDGIKNGGETGIDCGGTATAKCATGQGCAATVDCDNVLCNAGTKVCDPPSATDQLKNGNESDVDCGSSGPGTNTNAGRCAATLSCAADADCKSGGCNVKGKCAFARSCTVEHGGLTCGTGDATSAANQNEDCCTSADVPVYNLEGYANGSAFRLDKYQITSGRIRRFLTAVNGNVQGWVQANRNKVLAPGQLPSALDKFLPTGWTQADHPTDVCSSEGNTYPCNYGALPQVSGFRYNNNPGGNAGYGCYMGQGGYGTRTFFTTAAEDALVAIGEERKNGVSRDRSEEKAMTCTTYYILAAFCAWDGGRLETRAEYDAAYGGNGGAGRTYPWGSDTASRPIGFSELLTPTVGPTNNYGYTPPGNDYSVFNGLLTQGQKDALLARIDRANLQWNYFNRVVLDYRAPLENRAQAMIAAENAVNIANDQSVAVAPPGRYPQGVGRYGHADLLGNVLEITAVTGTVASNSSLPWGRNGSFETAHFDANTMLGYNGYAFDPLTKYGRAGGRCARPATIYPATPLP